MDAALNPNVGKVGFQKPTEFDGTNLIPEKNESRIGDLTPRLGDAIRGYFRGQFVCILLP